jgi:DNA polymerase V
VQYLAKMRTPSASTCTILAIDPATELELLLANAVAAGFPSPAQDYQEGVIDLNRELVTHPRSTFCVVVQGQSMQDANIGDGDILVVDKSIEPRPGAICVCCLDGEFTVKRIVPGSEAMTLEPANRAFKPIQVRPEQDFQVWGTVTYAIRKILGI